MNSNYKDGWDYAKGDYEDMIPYDPDFWPDHVVDAAAEDYIQGYYDFWEKKGFEL